MALLLAIETTTKNCSVALFQDVNLLHLCELNFAEYSHSENLTLLIEQTVKKANIFLKDIDAIVLSKGPGSYTGLRIGTATAKGLCYALDIPLVSLSTLKSMAFGMLSEGDYSFYCPMIDARRMEVFAAIYDQANNEVREVRADIVDANIYSDFLQEKVLFFGDGAFKCKEIIRHPNAHFLDGFFPSARHMGALGIKKFMDKEFENIAYFEPYYLKDFVIGKK